MTGLPPLQCGGYSSPIMCSLDDQDQLLPSPADEPAISSREHQQSIVKASVLKQCNVSTRKGMDEKDGPAACLEAALALVEASRNRPDAAADINAALSQIDEPVALKELFEAICGELRSRRNEFLGLLNDVEHGKYVRTLAAMRSEDRRL